MQATTSAKPAMALDALCTGFADITRQSQEVFRQVMAAMAEPGSIQTMDAIDAPQPLSTAAYQVALALLDQETPLWLSPHLASHPGVANSLRFHCGCALTDSQRDASFALIYTSDELELSAFNQGTFEYPDRSATLIVEVEQLAEGGDLQLTGPGIRGSRAVSIGGFDQHWLADLAANQMRFPCGVDLVLTCGDQLMALPRTTQIRRNGQEATPCT